MEYTIDVIAENGIRFRVIFVPDTEARGGTVEFFDREDLTPEGQHVSTCDLGEVLDGSNGGLVLNGMLEKWTIDARNMTMIRVWLRNTRDSLRTGVYA